MVFKASILLLFRVLFISECAHALAPDGDLKAALQKKDWPEVVLLLEPKQGQNFDHDLDLARAYLSLERRADALKLLGEQYPDHKEDRLLKLYTLAGSLFFNQETANLYYEAVRLISIAKFSEAKERLEQALSKEPGQVSVLTRLVQVEVQLLQKEQAMKHLKLAQSLAPYSLDLKLIGAGLVLDRPDEAEVDYQSFQALKTALMGAEVPLTFWIEVLKRTGKTNELRALAESVLKNHRSWTFAQMAVLKTGLLGPVLQKKYKAQIELNLKDKAQFESRLEQDMKQTQYLWVGFIRYEDLVKQLK